MKPDEQKQLAVYPRHTTRLVSYTEYERELVDRCERGEMNCYVWIIKPTGYLLSYIEYCQPWGTPTGNPKLNKAKPEPDEPAPPAFRPKQPAGPPTETQPNLLNVPKPYKYG